MRRIDLHCYPGTQEWITSQGPYVEALGTYWGKEWVAKSEDEVVADVTAAGVEAVLVAFDIESVTGAPPCRNDYVAALRDRHPGTFIQAWGAVDPFKGEQAIADAVTAVREHRVLGFEIATFKLPERVAFFDTLPLSGFGKVSKKELAARLASEV